MDGSNNRIRSSLSCVFQIESRRVQFDNDEAEGERKTERAASFWEADAPFPFLTKYRSGAQLYMCMASGAMKSELNGPSLVFLNEDRHPYLSNAIDREQLYLKKTIQQENRKRDRSMIKQKSIFNT